MPWAGSVQKKLSPLLRGGTHDNIKYNSDGAEMPGKYASFLPSEIVQRLTYLTGKVFGTEDLPYTYITCYYLHVTTFLMHRMQRIVTTQYKIYV